jgi:hypothetical protein
MTAPTHEEISLQAKQLWWSRGRPDDCDAEIWLEAERKLNEQPAAVAFATYVRAETAAESEVEYHLSPALTEEEAIQASMQQKDSRAARLPRHTGPKTKPPETGQPLWARSHSS